MSLTEVRSTGPRAPTDMPTRVPFLDLTAVTEAVRAQVEARWSEVLRSAAFIGGAAVEAFERELAAYCGTAEAVGMANGTDALHLTLRALDIGPGDTVVVPANTFVATVEAIVLAGAAPRFADVDPETLLLTPETVAAAVLPSTKAVIAVHLYGQMPDMVALSACADALGLLLVEDAAQAQGATYAGRRAGAYAVAGCFSFYPGKNLGAFGDAGAVVTSDPRLAATLRSMRDHGRALGTHYEHVVLGTNSRLDALQAVVLRAKLAHLDEWNASRVGLMAQYRDRLDPGRARLVADQPGGQGVHHLAVARVADRERVRSELDARGIGTGVHYPVPCHVMPPYRDYADGPLPAAEQAATEVLSLPMYPHLEPAALLRVVAAVNEVAGRLPR
ncbi:DegT/DnrJ/EryC1/StrS family aminotransferase [Nocardioides agariphilus]|nr:DegT/DnrJ/EryC1/StrS family aminotransferase [Nocardioides agariphilus]